MLRYKTFINSCYIYSFLLQRISGSDTVSSDERLRADFCADDYFPDNISSDESCETVINKYNT